MICITDINYHGSYMASFVSLISRLNNKEPGKCSSTLMTWDTTWLICHHVLIRTRMAIYKLYKAVFISWHLDTFWSNFMNCNPLPSLWSCTSPVKILVLFCSVEFLDPIDKIMYIWWHSAIRSYASYNKKTSYACTVISQDTVLVRKWIPHTDMDNIEP